MPRASRLAAAALLIAAAGCQRAEPEAMATADEQRLIAKLTTDPFVHVERLERDPRGVLIATTRQGSTTVRYRLRPQPPTLGTEDIERVVDELVVPVADDGTRGTGPDPRGLR